MTIILPKFLVLDSATLGNLARDFWSVETLDREKSRRFLSQLTARGVHVCITFTHLLELFRHPNDRIAKNRLSFLRSIDLIAWIRPYNRDWHPGSAIDIFVRELHEKVHNHARSWHDVIGNIATDFWETGTGKDMLALPD